jgi:hypothetical protein
MQSQRPDFSGGASALSAEVFIFSQQDSLEFMSREVTIFAEGPSYPAPGTKQLRPVWAWHRAFIRPYVTVTLSAYPAGVAGRGRPAGLMCAYVTWLVARCDLCGAVYKSWSFCITILYNDSI